MRHFGLAMMIGMSATTIVATAPREVSAMTEREMNEGKVPYRASWDCTVTGQDRDCRGFYKEFRADDDADAASKFDGWWLDNHPKSTYTKLSIVVSPGRL